ncbi:retrotransposon protein, putative, ty1-copia subclass [Tanacetum coccineum]
MTESPLVDSGFAVPAFSLRDDLISCLNKAMAFLTAVASLRFPSTNNQLRTSSNPRNQATIQDGRVTVQQVQGRQGQSYSGTGYKSNATSSRGNNASGQARVVKCYNCQGEGHMARQCINLKRLRNAAWYKDKAMLVEAHKDGIILDEEQLAFLADPGVPDGQAVQSIIPNNAAFQTKDLDTYDSDCDDISNAPPPPPAKKEHPAKDTEYHHCHKTRQEEELSSIFGRVEEEQSQCIWHISHINKKRIEKLHHDRLLELIDDESFDVCISCISGKMARKPFTHASERADDLLGIIHSDVCGPFRTTSRKGANYYITFTDDFNQGSKYLSQEFLDHLRCRGIISQLTPPYTPQYNGVSERRNRTLLDMVRSVMSLTTLPMSFWSYALEFAARILNMVPTKKVNKTPYEMWHGKVLNLSYLKVWGCEALVKRDTSNKLESRSIKCIFVGYLKEIIGYYFYYPLENKIFVARYAEFFEINLIKQEASGSTLEAMNAKMQSMKDNQVWNLVDLPPNCKTVRSKWLFKKKTNMDGNIHTYKARLVAKGFTQTYGVDYEETISPVTDIKAIRILIAIAAYYDYEI